MFRARTQLTLIMSLGLVMPQLAGCIPSELDRRLASIEQSLGEISRRQRDDESAFSSRLDQELSRVWGKLNCTNEQVRSFIKECESSDSPVCSEAGLASALTFMNTQAVVTMFLRPDLGISSLQPVRNGQLLGLTDTRFLFPSTRFLILTQPRSDAQIHQDEAEKIGRQLLRYMRTELKVPSHAKIIGPRVLPCKLKQEQLRFYGGRLHLPQVNEPTDKDPRVRVWLFRTDCQ